LEKESFAGLLAASCFVERLRERNITAPLEIQSRVMPRLYGGESLAFRSATGTGKTFAYLLPFLTRLLERAPFRGALRFLICAPTYELCAQIKKEMDFLLFCVPQINTALLIGSARIARQVDALKKDRPAVVVGNPGRLLHLANMGKIKFRGLEYLVLDEGDRLVSDELFGETAALVSLVLGSLPKGAGGETAPLQSAACSATFSAKSRERLTLLLGASLAFEEADGAEVLRDKVEHWAIFAEKNRKVSVLRSFLAAVSPGRALIFSSRAREVEGIVSRLRHYKLSAAGLSGETDKKLRKKALDDFRSGSVRFLVTSDLAARGLDIAGISHVIALDAGEDKDAYIHRAGRTARAGKKGVMVTIGDEGDLTNLSKLEKKLGIVVYPKELYGGKIGAPQPAE
jgi:superfamily II DNA/RNA helicase